MRKTAFVNGFEMEYDVFGQGEKTMVIIPGLSVKSVMLSAEAVESAYASFAQDHTVYMFDVRKNVPEGYSLFDFAEDTAAVMKSLGIEKADLFGASMGGMVSLMITAGHPELVSRLMVAATKSRKTESDPGTITLWREDAEAKDRKKLAEDMTDLIYCEETLKAFRETLLEGLKDITEEELRRTEILTKAIDAFDGYDRLGKITCPVFAVGSEGDRVFGTEGVREIAEATGGELYIYREYGHGLYDEAPDFRDRMHAFFS